MHPFVLVAFRHDCADDLVRLWRASFEHGVGVADPHSIDEQRAYLLDHLVPNHAVRLACAGSEMVGFVAATPESVSQLYVRVGFARRGIGTLLLDWAKQHSSGRLWLYTFARNTGARAFYEKNGFVPVAFGFEPNWKLDDVRYEWQRRGKADPATAQA
jgi:GNAT superfamily N-acetyltransferase